MVVMADAKSIVTWGFGHSSGGYSIPHIMTDGLLDTVHELIIVVLPGFLWFRKGWFARIRRKRD